MPPKIGQLQRLALSNGRTVPTLPKLQPHIKAAFDRHSQDLSKDQRAVPYINETKHGPYAFDDGSFYHGHSRNGKRHGLGAEIMRDGSYYWGLWEDDHFAGIGTRVWSNGCCYYGEWRADAKQGRGRLFAPDGTVLQGMWNGDELT